MERLMQIGMMLLGFIGIPVALYNLHYFRQGLNIQYVWALLILGGAAFLVSRIKLSKTSYNFLGLSAILAFATYWLYPNVFVDDTGFVVRYLRSAADGCFYCYNVEDGPVFGISSFLYGFVTSVIALPGLLKPEHIIIGVNFLGLFWLFFMLLKLLYRFTQNVFMSAASLGMILVLSANFMVVTTGGLETNFHLAVVFTAIYYFFENNRKRMWLFMALSVISKLDTVPLMVVLGGVHLIENRKDYLGEGWKRSWLDFGIYAVVPQIVFVALTYILFDGPLPQSAYAKLNYHVNPSEHWFPFLEMLILKGERHAMLKFAIAIPVVHAILSLYLKNFKLRDYVFGLGFAATMALFYLYNPAERMWWYYAMPELLMYMQLMVSSAFVIKASGRFAEGKYMLLLAAYGIAALPLIFGEKPWNDQYLKTVENERLVIGEYIDKTIPATDTLVASHGHFGAHFPGYVLDMSGLNSRFATDIERNMEVLLPEYRPGWFIHHGDSYLIHLANMYGYRLDHAFYNVTKYGHPTWLLFKRSDQKRGLIRYAQEHILNSWSLNMAPGGMQVWADVVIFANPFNNVSAVWMGLENMSQSEQHVSIIIGEETFDYTIPVQDKTQPHTAIVSISAEAKKLYDNPEIKVVADSVLIHDPMVEVVN